MKIAKLNINCTETGINLDVDGAPEGIHIEYEILPDITKALMECVLGNQAATQDDWQLLRQGHAMTNGIHDPFQASIRGLKISVERGHVTVHLDGNTQLDMDDVQAVIKALDTANTIAGLGT